MEISSGRLTAPCLPLPLRTRTSPAPTTGLATLSRYPPALLGLQRQRKALPNSAHLLTGITAGTATTPVGGPFKSPSPSPLVPDVVAGSSRGAELLVSQDWATGPRRFAQGAFVTRPPAQPCRLHNSGPVLPASSIRPGCRPREELAAPTSVTGSLRTSNVTPGQFGGQWLPREAPRMPDA